MNLSPFVDRVRAVVGEAHLLTDPAETAPYYQDWRGRYTGNGLAVARPRSAEEVASIVRLAAEAGVAVVAQGGNTGLVGGAIPLGDRTQLLVSLSRLNRIRAIDPDNATLTVEAGVTLAQVHEAAEKAHLLFPLSLASEGSCEIGGNLSTNAGGTAVLRYGNTRDLTLGLEVVLANGMIWNGLRGLRKDNTGYDLKHLFIGSEGTLGIITAAVLKLFPRPRTSVTALVGVRGIDQTVLLLRKARAEIGDRLTGFEIFADVCKQLVLRHIPGSTETLPGLPWYCLLQLDDPIDDASLDEKLQSMLGDAIESGVAVDAVIASSIAQAKTLWALRENISEAQRLEGYSIKHDIALPISRVPEFLQRAEAALSAAYPGVRFMVFGHLGDGNLHYNLSYPTSHDNLALLADTPQVNRIVHDLVHDLGGSISAEHGVGVLKRGEIARYKSPVEIELMRAVKQALDPHGLLNPGKVFPD